MPRRAYHPCTGGCGSLCWKPDTLCHSCRRARRGAPRPPQVLEERTCLRASCGTRFNQRKATQVYCTPLCRSREQYRRADERAACNPRSGHAYRELRALVKAQEPTCWQCGHLIDPARQWPDPWSFSLDHVRPIAHGGAPLDRDNARAAHLRCNVRAGTAIRRRAVRRPAA